MGFGHHRAAILAVLVCGAVWTSDVGTTTSLVVTIVVALAALDHHKRGYWKRLGVPTVSGSLPLLGHAVPILMCSDKYIHEVYEKFLQEHKDSKVCGLYFFWTPFAMATDAEMVKNVTIKDFDHFVDRRVMTISNTEDEYSNDFLTAATGDRWRGIRQVLSPTFSSGKMKRMFPMILKKADVLNTRLHQEINKDNTTLDMLHYCGRLTTDVIASCAFGFEINALENDNVEFVQKLAKASNFNLWSVFVIIFAPMFPRLANVLDISMWKKFRYHRQVLEKSIKTRIDTEKLGAHGDFIDLILEAKKESEENAFKSDITHNTVIASSVIFLIAGFDTVKNTLVVLLHHLAENPTVQDKLRQEIQDLVRENGTLTYQSVMESKYLDAVISESQRIVPAIGAILERKCTKPYVIPGTDMKIEKDILVQWPLMSLQRDERYWKDGNTYNPENFMPPNKQNIVTGSFMPFGIGPRHCIAQRFALMELKIVTARLIQDFKLSLAPGREELGLMKGPIFRLFDEMPYVLTPVREE